MTQIITGPDGVEHEFPDETPDDVIKGVMQKTYGSSAGPPAAPTDGPGGAASADVPSGLLSRLAQPFHGAEQATEDYARHISDVFSAGGSDRINAYWNKTNLADEQAKTAAARDRLGLMQYPAAAIGYAANPISRISGGLGGGLLA